MSKLYAVVIMILAASLPPVSAEAAEISGKALYDRYCASCHPKGGNVIKPDKDLLRLSRESRGIRTAKDVVGRMRHPAGPQMPRFDKSYISDENALKIGEYVVSSFK